MKKEKPFAISRDFIKRDFESDNLSQNPAAQSSTDHEDIEKLNRRDVLKSLVPGVAKSLGQVLKDFKVRTFEVLDKIEKK